MKGKYEKRRRLNASVARPARVVVLAMRPGPRSLVRAIPATVAIRVLVRPNVTASTLCLPLDDAREKIEP